MPVLIDYSQTFISSVMAGRAHFGDDLNPDMIRHLFFNQLISIRKKFQPKFGELVICCDGGKSWRKDFFPFYKARRKESRAEDPFDWEGMFKVMDETRQDLDARFPYKVVRVNNAEGDDVIATLTKYFQDNETTQVGLDDVQQKVMIISSDKDFEQLQVFKNVSQYAPSMDKHIRVSDPITALHEKVVRGDAGDGVPNIWSQDDCFVLRIRQTPATSKKLTPVMEALANGDDLPADLQRNYQRNRTLIDLLHCIPDEVSEAIIDTYKNAPVAPRSQIFPYLVEKKLKNLMTDIDKF